MSNETKRNVTRLKDLQQASRHLEVVPVDEHAGVYLVESASHHGEHYQVTISGDTLDGSCTCPWAQHGGINCKHVLAVLRAHYAEQGHLAFWHSQGDAKRQHRHVIAGPHLYATLRRAA